MSSRRLSVALVVMFLLGSQARSAAQVIATQQDSMLKPPPVSGQSYRTETALEEKSNTISGSIAGGVGYVDNLYPGSTLGLTSETIFLLQPTISFDTSSAREHASASYNPQFVFYRPTSALNEADQNGLFRFQYRFTPRLTMDLSDSVLRASTGFIQIGNGGVSGSTPPTTPGVALPFGERFINTANGGLSYQFSLHGMVGASGNFSTLTYPDKSQTTGLYDSDSRGGTGFYSHRLTATQYLGAIYKYDQILAYPQEGQYETKTNTISGFYTIYLTETLSLSVAGGPQHYTGTHEPDPTVAGWAPSVMGSMGWQGRHTSLAASVSRSVTGGGGLVGTFNTRSAGLSGRWQMTRLWLAGANVNYAINKNAIPSFASISQGGHSLTTSLTLGRTITSHSSAVLTYDRIHSRYDGVQQIAANPNSNRVVVSFVWAFQRPVGR